ncbi:MAG: protein kinase [Myxococcota bacterium]
MPKSTPQRFGPYVILDRIGDGGMAEIFLAKMQGYSGFEKLVALKKIHPRYSRNQTFARMLIHEAKLAASLNHFNVIQVHDLGEIDGQVYIAMEYVHGKDMAAVLSNTYRRRERLPLNLALCVATEFMTGLDYAHRVRDVEGQPLGIIHRDISPQNVLISNEGEVKLTDFGIARVLASKDDAFQLPGNLHGKFGYMSPEQVKGLEIDQRSDIFSSGVVLWEMLTGRRLFRGKEHKETIKLIVSMAIPLPSSINHEVPPSVDAICLKALSRDPNTRYQTTGALLGELSRAADQLPQRAATRDLSVYMRRQFGPGTPGYGAGRTSSPRRNPTPPVDDSAEKRARLSRNTGDRVPVGQLLMEQGALTAQDLDIALAEQRARGGRIGELLVASGTVTEEDLLQAISSQASLPSIGEDDLLALTPPTKLLQRFPKEAAEATLILPISINEQQRSVGLAVNDPYDERAILETKVVLGVNDVVTFLAKRTAIRAAIEAWYIEEEEEVEDDAIIYESPVFEDAVEVVDGNPVVLIADADREQAEALADRIREEDCKVVVASDGKDARSVCREGRPIVAFLDASLPGIDGYNLLLELRSRNEDAAVFITSTRGDEFRQAKALELGADDFIVKPYSLEVVTSKVRREIRRRGSAQQVRAPTVQFEGVSGSLKDMTALDIIQGLELGRKTAHVVLQYEDGRNGALRIDQGQIGGSIMGTQNGESAFYALTRHGRGLFRIEYRSSPLPRNILKPNTYLMIEAMRQLDESQTSPPQLRRAPQPAVTRANLTDDLSVDAPNVPVPLQLEPTPPRLSRPQEGPDGRLSSIRRTAVGRMPLRRVSRTHIVGEAAGDDRNGSKD